MIRQPKSIIPAAVGLPVRKNGKGLEFLLTRRQASHRPNMHNKWQLPGGGIEFGETPEQALEREFLEEISVKSKLLYPNPFVRTTVWYGGDDDVNHDIQILLICYIVTLNNQTPVIRCQETNAMDWFSFEKAMKLECLPNTREFVEEANQLIADYKIQIED